MPPQSVSAPASPERAQSDSATDTTGSPHPGPSNLSPCNPGPSNPGPSLLQVRSLAVAYGFRLVFRGVDFDVPRGECLAVAGANGAGKSTLLRALSGLVRPREGRIELNLAGAPVVVWDAGEGSPEILSRHVGLATPEIQLYEELTAVENLRFFARVRGLQHDRATIEAALEEAGLNHRANDRLGSFSSGMKQRMRLLFALQHDPPLLLLDEPGSNLDDAGRSFVEAAIVRQLRRGSVVLATNDPAELEYGHQVLRLGR